MSLLPPPYNPERFEANHPPYNVYKCLYYTGRCYRWGYTLEKHWYDLCLRLRLRCKVEAEFGTLEELLEWKRDFIKRKTDKYAPRRCNQNLPTKHEVSFWWVNPRGSIDRSVPGDPKETQDLKATITLGLATSMNTEMTERSREFVEIGWHKATVGMAPELGELLNAQLREIGTELTVEKINSIEVPGEGEDGEPVEESSGESEEE